MYCNTSFPCAWRAWSPKWIWFQETVLVLDIYCLVSSFMRDTWRQGKVPRWLSRRLQNCFRNIWPQCVVHTVLCEDTWIQLEGSSTPGSDQESGNHHRSTSPSQFRWNLSLTRNSKCWKQAYPTHFPQFLECACVYFFRGIWTYTASEMHVARRIFSMDVVVV